MRIDRVSGKRVFGNWPGNDPKSAVIWEAFKAETEPKRSIRQDELAARGDQPVKKAVAKSAQKSSAAAVTSKAPANNPRDQELGGIY